MRIFSIVLCVMFTKACVILHHVQVGDIDDTKTHSKRLDVKVSETGFNIEEASKLVKTFKSQEANQVMDVIRMFQIGPRTGNPVFDVNYGDKVLTLILEDCPSGRITGLSSVRETAKYPLVSGEIINITGWCRE